MKIGFREVNINPTFPVNRMKRPDKKNMAVHDDLHCRILCIEEEGKKPWYHFSIDTVEIWRYFVERMHRECEEVLGREIDLVVSATHTHNACCCTTDGDYRDFLMQRIREEIPLLEMKEFNKVEYSYSYRYYNKMGDSREANMKHKVVHLYAEALSLYGDGKRVGTILIHNSHPTVKRLGQDDFTAEYVGYIIAELQKKYPGEFFTFMLGPAGDVSPHYVREKRDFEEIAVLGDKLVEEYCWQLQHQDVLKPVDKFSYREQVMEVDRIKPVPVLPPFNRLTEQEKEILEHQINPTRPRQNKPEEEYVKTHVFSQVIFSEDYSIIFEPFELYSEYYGAVNKSTTSIVSISNGFDHYLTGLYLNHVVQHGTFSCDISDQMKRDIWELFGKWSYQEDCEF